MPSMWAQVGASSGTAALGAAGGGGGSREAAAHTESAPACGCGCVLPRFTAKFTRAALAILVHSRLQAARRAGEEAGAGRPHGHPCWLTMGLPGKQSC